MKFKNYLNQVTYSPSLDGPISSSVKVPQVSVNNGEVEGVGKHLIESALVVFTCIENSLTGLIDTTNS